LSGNIIIENHKNKSYFSKPLIIIPLFSARMKEIILKYALKNALDFQGKINAKAVLGQVLREHPELRQQVPEALKEIETMAKEVAKLSSSQIQEKLQKIAPQLLEKEPVVEGPLKPLPKAVPGKVVLRIAPSPSGPLHIGHAYGVSLNYEYAKMYNGKLILRIEDTNPENIYPPAYEMIEDDVKWLTGLKELQVVVQSSRLGIYYDCAEKLVRQGNAYVCRCDADSWRENKNKGIACPCRDASLKENQTRYAQMFSTYAEGEAILRLKTDIKDKNPALRDFGLMRIVQHIHPKIGKEQRVWPLMVFSVAVDDHELGITHVLNGKDQTDNAIKEKMIMSYLGWKHPEYKHWGIINFVGFTISKSETKLAIEKGTYTGWDDIRIPFLQSLRRRGYQPEAFRRFAIEVGLSLNDKTVTMEEFWKMIDSFNRDIVESKANRYFLVDHPILMALKGFPAKTISLSLHPDFPERGKRTFEVDGHFYIAEQDFRQLSDGYIHRLMDCANFKLDGEQLVYVPGNYEDYKNAEDRGKIIHWLPANKTVKVEAHLNTGVVLPALGEDGLARLKVGDIVQLERNYFARIDEIDKNKVKVWYLHT